MFKYSLAIVLVVLTSFIYLAGIPFITNSTTQTCVDGKSSGSFVSGLTYTQNDGCFFTLNNQKECEKFLKNLNLNPVYFEEVNGVKNYYYFTNKLIKKEVIKGKCINIHIAVSKDKTTIGYPIIYGGY